MKILIVDDEPLVRRSLHRALERDGWTVFEAEDGQKGVEQWLLVKPDVVLLDVLMPALSGPQVLENIPPEIRKKSRIAMMSAFTGEWSQSKTKELGVETFIPKPFEDIFEVCKIIKELARSGRDVQT